MSVITGISLIAVVVSMLGLVTNAIALNFISEGPALNRCVALCRIFLGATAVSLGVMIVALFQQIDDGTAKAFLMMMLLVVPYLLFISIKGFGNTNKEHHMKEWNADGYRIAAETAGEAARKCRVLCNHEPENVKPWTGESN